MAQQAPLVFCISFDSPHHLFRVMSRARRSQFHDSVVSELEAPSIKQNLLLLRKRDEPRQKEEKSGGAGVEVSEKRFLEGGDTQERDVL